MVDEKEARRIAELLVSKLSDVRDERQLSYDNLAMLVGTNKSTIFALENKGTLPNLLTLVKICMALDIKISDIAADIDF